MIFLQTGYGSQRAFTVCFVAEILLAIVAGR
jgi:hypothetical protein